MKNSLYFTKIVVWFNMNYFFLKRLVLVPISLILYCTLFRTCALLCAGYNVCPLFFLIQSGERDASVWVHVVPLLLFGPGWPDFPLLPMGYSSLRSWIPRNSDSSSQFSKQV